MIKKRNIADTIYPKIYVFTMPLFAKIIVAIELGIFAFIIVAIIIKIVERVRESKKDKYKKVKY